MMNSNASVYLPVLVVGQNGATGTPAMVGLPEPAQAAPGAVTQQPGTPPAGGPPGPASPFGGNQFIFIMLAMLGLMVFMSFWTNRKEKKKREELMSSMRKGDRVQTLGGIIGTLQEVYDHEVVLRLEEGRVRVARSSVQTIIKSVDGAPGERTPSVEVKNTREKASV